MFYKITGHVDTVVFNCACMINPDLIDRNDEKVKKSLEDCKKGSHSFDIFKSIITSGDDRKVILNLSKVKYIEYYPTKNINELMTIIYYDNNMRFDLFSKEDSENIVKLLEIK
jgi:hypothetical protein